MFQQSTELHLSPLNNGLTVSVAVILDSAGRWID
jgi:hypothetical protein